MTTLHDKVITADLNMHMYIRMMRMVVLIASVSPN